MTSVLAPSRFPKIKGFDPLGEPEISAGDDGALVLMFNAMPPTDKAGNDREARLFDDFERVLSNALLTTVLRDDRERFVIREPSADSVKTLATYLSNFWKQHAQALREALPEPGADTAATFRNALEFREAMGEHFSPVFRPHGFRTSLSQTLTFTRKFAGGHDRIEINLDGRNEVTCIEPAVTYYVQHETVERLVSICCEQEKKYLKNKATSGFHRVALPATLPIVSNAADAAAWARQCQAEIEGQVLAGLACWRDLETIDAVLNDLSGDAGNYEKLPSSYQYNGPRGILIAKLLGRKNLEDTIAFHRRFIKTDDENNYFQIYQDRCFAAACDFVRSKSIAELEAIAAAF
jgi:hypothetical protein